MSSDIVPVLSVRLDCGLWWPAVLTAPKFEKFKYSESNARIARLMGVDETVTIDPSASDSVIHPNEKIEFLDFHKNQDVPISYQIEFHNAMTELEVILEPSESAVSISTSTQKRSDAIIWDDYFLAVAFLSAMRSKDPSTQVGACIVNSRNRIVGIGYNGFPKGCSDDVLPWARTAECELDTKYPVSTRNATVNSD